MRDITFRKILVWYEVLHKPLLLFSIKSKVVVELVYICLFFASIQMKFCIILQNML